MSILVVGSVAYDDVTTPYGKAQRALGGSATYFSAAASFFSPVKIVAVVGEDFDPAELDFLRKRGVDTSGLMVAKGETFRWAGSYGKEMGDATTHATLLNVFQDFDPEIPEAHRKEPFVFLANIDPVLQLKVLDQVEKPRLVVCDTMNFWIAGKRLELEELMGVDEIYRLLAYPVEEVHDPTGAGDTFAGGFVGQLAETGDLSFEGMHRALLTGTVTASFTVEAFSTRGLQEIDRAAIDARCRRLEQIAGWTWNGGLVPQG